MKKLKSYVREYIEEIEMRTIIKEKIRCRERILEREKKEVEVKLRLERVLK